MPRLSGLPESDDGVNMNAVLSDLFRRGILSVLVEGGGRVHHTLMRSGLVDQVQLFIAPMVLAEGPGWVQGQPFSLAGAPDSTSRNKAMWETICTWSWNQIGRKRGHPCEDLHWDWAWGRLSRYPKGLGSTGGQTVRPQIHWR